LGIEPQALGCCRACGSPLQQVFVDLGPSPIAKAMRRPDDIADAERIYPLRTFVCSNCKLVQTQDVLAADAHFHGSYTYFSSYSASWLKHAETYVDAMMARYGFGRGSLVVEVASNDGYLLQYFKRQGVPVLGIDPAANCAAVAEKERGIPTLTEFFGTSSAARIAAGHGQADLIICNNVLAHVPDINDFAAGLRLLLKPQGRITIEFPHLLRLIEASYFDTIYHEHYSYLSLTSLERLLVKHQLRVFDIDELRTHGGSLRVYVEHVANSAQSSATLRDFRQRESNAGLNELDVYAGFPSKVTAAKRAILKTLIAVKEQGGRIVAYGAAA
jgi:SAM-dependent methyltransferase